MIPIFFYDANIFSTMEHETLKTFTDDSFNILTDDVAKELMEGKIKYTENTNFNDNLKLVFNENNGINKNFFLLLSHVPVWIPEIAENTENAIELKRDPDICSFHHLWLPFILNPSVLTMRNRHYYSELTWRLSRGDVNYDDNKIQNFKNKLRLDETKSMNKMWKYSDIKVSKIIRAWSKRDKDIRDNKHKVTDARLLVHALSAMMVYRQNVNILTSDYDLIDLHNTLFDCLYDQYVINSVIKQKSPSLNIDEGTSKEIVFQRTEFIEEVKKINEKLIKSKNFFSITVWFYNRDTKKVYPFENIIPDWMCEFLKEFRGTVDCLALRNTLGKTNTLKYMWYDSIGNDVKFKVWKDRKFSEADVVKPMLCKMYCRYEMTEINNPKSISSFLAPEDV